MGKTNYSKCVELINKNLKKGKKVGYVRLSQLIMMNIGSDPRTISNTIKLMLKSKLIKDVGNSHFKIR